jgi:hypothetical protein
MINKICDFILYLSSYFCFHDHKVAAARVLVNVLSGAGDHVIDKRCVLKLAWDNNI